MRFLSSNGYLQQQGSQHLTWRNVQCCLPGHIGDTKKDSISESQTHGNTLEALLDLRPRSRAHGDVSDDFGFRSKEQAKFEAEKPAHSLLVALGFTPNPEMARKPTDKSGKVPGTPQFD